MAGQKYALVIGASGVTGWSFVNEILSNYPKKGVWGGVIAMTNRPLSLEKSCWPKDDRLTIVSGIDLLKGTRQDVEKEMKGKIPNLDKVTDTIYVAYKANVDDALQNDENIEMLKRVVLAADHLCPRLESFVLQTGSKHYGCHLLANRPANMKSPLAETLPRMQPPDSDGLFYPPQMDFLAAYSADKTWGWIDTRPDIVVGFVPNHNFFSLGTSLGIYLSLRREIDGADAACPFPGTAQTWVTKSHDSSAEMIARQSLTVSLSSAYRGTKGQSFNVADERMWRTWATRWPALCTYFGLQGVKAPEDNPVEVRAYIRAHAAEWQAMEDKYGLQSGHVDHPQIFPGFEYYLISRFDFDRQFDMSKMYDEIGFTEERDPTQAWGRVFDHMKAAKIIPKEFS